jgi:tRNA(fMet)-specific endonuclease VapC
MNYLLDTNVISELIARQPNPQVVAWVDSMDPSTVFLSVITIGEIRKGIEKAASPERRAALSTWLNSDLLVRFDGKIATITAGVALRWGELTGRLEQAGRPAAALDSLIAAITLEGDFTLVTRNEGDFAHTGVRMVNPWASPAPDAS